MILSIVQSIQSMQKLAQTHTQLHIHNIRQYLILLINLRTWTHEKDLLVYMCI